MRAFCILATLALLAASGTPARAAEHVDTIATRPGVTVKAIVRNEGAVATAPLAILFAGSDGILSLDSWDGKKNPTSNFLVRTRKHFARGGLWTVVPDVPSDMQTDGLVSWRTNKEHSADIGAIVRHVRKYSSGPAFLVGTSRGTVSAAAGTANLPPGTIAGVVLTASVTRYNKSGTKHRVHDAPIKNITVPVLFAHHKDDVCYVTVYTDLEKLAREFTRAPKVEIKGYTGGGKYRGSECGALSAHGFRGIEIQVVGDIVTWIKAVAANAKRQLRPPARRSGPKAWTGRGSRRPDRRRSGRKASAVPCDAGCRRRAAC